MGHFANIAYQQAHPLVGLQYLNSLIVRRLLEILPVHFNDLIAHLRSLYLILDISYISYVYLILELQSRMR